MDEYESVVSTALHELRYFNQRLKGLSEQLSKEVKVDEIGNGVSINANPTHADQIRTIAEGILSLSQLFTTRLDFIDIELNPGVVQELSVSSINIFGKFDKARRMLNSQARGKKVKVKIDRPSRAISNIDAYPLIDILPYLILDNAIKYSPDKTEVAIDFEVYTESLVINICSLGPHVPSEEIEKLTEKGFRGNGAKLLDVGGSGLGLHFVKYICELHEIELAIKSSSPICEYKGVGYSSFDIKLTIPTYNHPQ